MESARLADEITLAGTAFTGEVAGWNCSACGAESYDGVALRRFEYAVADALAALGVGGGSVLRFLRKLAGLRAADLAALLDVAPETLSRWESGERDASPGVVALLGAMVADRRDGRTTTADRLRALTAHRPPPKVVKVAAEVA